MTRDKKLPTGVSIESGGSIHIGGDVVGGDKITLGLPPGQRELERMLSKWQELVKVEVEGSSLPSREKDDLRRQVSTIKTAILQDGARNPARLERLINTLAIMGPDIFDVVIATLADPLAGIGLTIRKISDRARLESMAQ